jgi:hypothetical protein
LDAVLTLASGLLFFIVGALAVAVVEYRGAERKGTERNGSQDTGRGDHGGGRTAHLLRHPWRPLAGGICAGGLGGASAAEMTIPRVGRWAEEHPVFTGSLTGAALLGITVLIIDALMRLLASRSWQGTLKARAGPQ